MNRAEANVIKQAAFLTRDMTREDASEGERELRLMCLVLAVNDLVSYRKRHKKRAQKPVSTTGRLRDRAQVSERPQTPVPNALKTDV